MPMVTRRPLRMPLVSRTQGRAGGDGKTGSQQAYHCAALWGSWKCRSGCSRMQKKEPTVATMAK